MLSLCELRRAVVAVEARFVGARLAKIVQPSGCEVMLVFARAGDAAERSAGTLVLSCRPGAARIGALAAPPPARTPPPAFAQLLRARLSRARLVGACLVDSDRQAALRLESRAGAFDLLLSILGPRSNLYLLDAEGLVVGALRPLEQTRRDLLLGAPWRSPASASPPEGVDRFAAEPDARLLEAIERAGREREDAGEASELERRVARALRRESVRVERKRAQLTRELPAPGEAEQARFEGELLKSVLREIRPRQQEVRARRWDTGEEVVLALDPALSARRNLEVRFERFRKARRREELVTRELDVLRTRAAEIESAQGRLAELEAVADATQCAGAVRELSERPLVAEALARHAPQAAPLAKPAVRTARRGAQRGVAARLQPLRYRTRDGLEVWVGRSAEGNDHLTLRLARGNDLFVHVEDGPGSHVILRTPGRREAPDESLLEACELAVHHSKLRRASVATVHVTAVKNVRKPAGAKPGLVHVLRGRTFELRRLAARLERILAARLDAEPQHPAAPGRRRS